jgi:serpin B
MNRLKRVFGRTNSSGEQEAENQVDELTVVQQIVENSDAKSVVQGNTLFALDLYAELRKIEGNLFFSPYSITTALAMTYGGARENTAKQMAQTLHFAFDQVQLHPIFAEIEAKIRSVQQGDNQLNIANAL